MTFVGQFIDHDLTMNALNLFELEAGPVQNFATPQIDLDCVYGLRSALSAPPEAIFDGDRFRLTLESGVFDVPRAFDPSTGAYHALISDARNDDNLIIIQIHILIMRVHNKFIDEGFTFSEAKRRTILNWQSVVINDYLPRIVQPDILHHVLELLADEPFTGIKNRPSKDLSSGLYKFELAHEFSIGFRMGHSQLRRSYQLNPDYEFQLFNTQSANAEDLRGGQRIDLRRKIDWPYFFGRRANAIDGKVTSTIFDLPESAIPDEIKYVVNLPHRNLIRSRLIGLCSGEDLADFYGVAVLTKDEIEPDRKSHHLFTIDGRFRTPLWYYLLKEAERSAAAGSPRGMLGPAGSYLVAEVIAGAVRYGEDNVWTAGDSHTWSIRSGRDSPERVLFMDIVHWLDR